MAGTLFVVATPIGNLEDITARALRVLREVDLIAAEDTRRTAQLLTRFGITTATTSLHQHNERAKGGELIDRLLAGESIALVSDAGTPGISDPGSGLVAEASAAGVSVTAIPGASAITALLSVSGRDASRFSFLGFPPVKSNDRNAWLESLADSAPLAVFYEAPHRILPTLTEISDRFGDLTVCVGREMTKAHEQLVKGPISEVLERFSEPRGEFVVAVDVPEKSAQQAVSAPTAQTLWGEFCEMTKNEGSTRRQAVSALSRRHRMSARDVYEMLESAKDSVG